MRIDKFLKVSRLIKRRTIANEACDAGKVLINDRVAKSGAKVKVGDEIKLKFGTRTLSLMVQSIQENARKEEASQMYTITGDEQ